MGYGVGMSARASFCLSALSLSLLAGCGARGIGLDDETAGTTTTTATTTTSTTGTTTGTATAKLPIALYVDPPSTCPESRPVETAYAELSPPEQGDYLALVEIYYRDECTGAGGQHIIAHADEDASDHWLGAHACYFFPVPPPPEPQYGVLLYNQTAALFHISPDVCIGFPGEPPGVTSSSIARALAVFETREDAAAFMATLPGPP